MLVPFSTRLVHLIDLVQLLFAVVSLLQELSIRQQHVILLQLGAFLVQLSRVLSQLVRQNQSALLQALLLVQKLLNGHHVFLELQRLPDLGGLSHLKIILIAFSEH